MTKNPLVSIIIPTLNAGSFLEECLKSIKNQSYKNIETIVVDGGSTDHTLLLAKKFKAKIHFYDPRLPPDKYAAPHRRNYGVGKAKGEYIYYMDADYRLSKNVVRECVRCFQSGYDAVITPLDTVGSGIWTHAKNLERTSYFGDDTVEAPRFVKRSVWNKLGGLDDSLGAGGDDWDFYQKLLVGGYKVGRVKSVVNNDEGNMKLTKLFWKAFLYGRDAIRYLYKRPKSALRSYFPIRPGYIRNWRLFLSRPVDTLALIVIRIVEYTGGVLGVLYSLIKPDKSTSSLPSKKSIHQNSSASTNH